MSTTIPSLCTVDRVRKLSHCRYFPQIPLSLCSKSSPRAWPFLPLQLHLNQALLLALPSRTLNHSLIITMRLCFDCPFWLKCPVTPVPKIRNDWRGPFRSGQVLPLNLRNEPLLQKDWHLSFARMEQFPWGGCQNLNHFLGFLMLI